MYIETTLPQTWHLDSPDPNSISIIIPLTEYVFCTEFAGAEHQPRSAMIRWMDKYGFDTFPSHLTSKSLRAALAAKKVDVDKAIDEFRKVMLKAEFCGQNFCLDQMSFRTVRAGDVIFFHSYTVHRGGAHFPFWPPKVALFLQLQYTADTRGTYSADQQIYCDITMRGMVDCDEKFCHTVCRAIDNYEQRTNLLMNQAWAHPTDQEDFDMLAYYQWYISRNHRDHFDVYLPNVPAGLKLATPPPICYTKSDDGNCPCLHPRAGFSTKKYTEGKTYRSLGKKVECSCRDACRGIQNVQEYNAKPWSTKRKRT